MPLTRKLSTKSLIKQNTSQDSSNSANQTITKNTFTASGVGPYSLTVSPGSINNTQVYINGVYQEKNNYTLVGNQITFSVAPPSGTSIEVISGSSYNIGTPNDGSVTTAKISSGAAAAGTLLTANGIGGVSFTNTPPTLQRLTSGTSATYTTPANVKYIKVRMVGGGGGGAGGAQNTALNGGAGGAGGNTLFGSATANGGNGGPGGSSAAGSTGGTGSLGTFTVGYVVQGGSGTAGAASVFGPNSATGGHGGCSVFLGNGVGQIQTVGTAAAVNSGSGGGGGAGSSATNVWAGAGGGGGGYVEIIINSPSPTYTYTIGTAGTAGTAGTSGVAGGAGGSGVIIVEEYYQ